MKYIIKINFVSFYFFNATIKKLNIWLILISIGQCWSKTLFLCVSLQRKLVRNLETKHKPTDSLKHLDDFKK